ncbi:hypothetical protein Tco_1409737 [Tanacetum coccineum]
MRMGRVKVMKGCRVMMTGIRKKNCVYTLEENVMTFGVQKHGGSKQVRNKQLGSKQVGFKQLGPGVETGVHGVQVDKRVWFEVELQGTQGNREAEVRANIMVTGVVGQEGAEDNVSGKEERTGKVKIHLYDGSRFILKMLGSKQVRNKQLGSKQVGFKQLGPGVETGVHGVQVDKCVWFEVELQGTQGNREAEVFQIIVGQEGAEDNVAGKEESEGVYGS